MKKKWQYCGDMNIENGGTFYCLENLSHGYAEAVRIYPCSDAGAQPNCWWVEEHSINIPDSQEVLEKALLYSGMDPNTATPLMRVMAAHEYGEYEQDSCTAVQIGPDLYHYDSYGLVDPDFILRSGTDLEKWVRRKYKLGRK